jgi:hypothetical protein
MLIEVEDESTRARGRGQFPKFGAVREKTAAYFGQGAAIKKILRMFDSSMWCAVLLAVSKREEEFVEGDRDYFHSGCTGNAERQLPGSQFSVVSWVCHWEGKPATDLRGFSRIKQILGEGRV